MRIKKRVIWAVFVSFLAVLFGSNTGWSDEHKTGNVRNGKLLYDKLKCSYCHKINGKGGNTGPDLSKEGARNKGIEWQMRHLVDPESQHTKQPDMPKFDKLTDKMLLDLAAYLESLK